MRIEVIDGERGMIGPCWCGAEEGWFSMTFVDHGCGGLGTVHCHCGGDLCVCHNHGELECPGCEDCALMEDDGLDYE